MPFYGDPRQFREAVESVLAQDDDDWRLFVLDDAYPDTAPGEWLAGIGDPRIDYRRHPRNVGINANFQLSLESGDAPWLVIMGCDDRLLPGYVRRVKQLVADAPDAAIIHPGVRVIDDAGSEVLPLVDRSKRLYRGRLRTRRTLQGEALATSITRGNWMYFPALAWRRDSVMRHGFRPELDVAQDLALALDVAVDGGALVVDPEVVFEYRRHAGSVSSWSATDGSRFVEEQLFFRELAARFRAHGWHRAARAARLHVSSRINALTRIPGALRTGQPGSVGLLLRHALGASTGEARPRRP
jgi:glycosyltransferase involved in cell wall biosynthesis